MDEIKNSRTDLNTDEIVQILKVVHEDALYWLRDTIERVGKFRSESWWAGFTSVTLAMPLGYFAQSLENSNAVAWLFGCTALLLVMAGIGLVWNGFAIKVYPGINWGLILEGIETKPPKFNDFYRDILGSYPKSHSLLIDPNQETEGILTITKKNNFSLNGKQELQGWLLTLIGLGLVATIVGGLVLLISV